MTQRQRRVFIVHCPKKGCVRTVAQADEAKHVTKSHLKLVTPAIINRTVTPKRLPNAALRTREYPCGILEQAYEQLTGAGVPLIKPDSALARGIAKFKEERALDRYLQEQAAKREE
jgi:hypothetical protein